MPDYTTIYTPQPDAPRTSFSADEVMSPQEQAEWQSRPENMPQQDFELGRLTIKRQFTDDMKIANGFKDIDPETYSGLAAEARMTLQSRLNKLQVNLDRSEMQFKQIRQNPNYDANEQAQLMQQYYAANPVWSPPDIGRQKQVSPEQQMMTEIMAGMGGQEGNAAQPASSARVWSDTGESSQPSGAASVTVGGQGGAPAAISPESGGRKPSPEQIAEYQRLGGATTKEGMAYRRQIMNTLEEPAGKPVKVTPFVASFPEPLTQEVFESTVARLKATDMNAAKEYYGKWSKKWQ